MGRLVLVRAGAAEGFREGMLLGTRNSPLSTLGRVQGQKAAELLMEIQVRSSPIASPKYRLQAYFLLYHAAWALEPDCDWFVKSKSLLIQVDEVLTSPLTRAVENARTISEIQGLAGFPIAPVTVMDSLNNRDWGSLEGKLATEVLALLCSHTHTVPDLIVESTLCERCSILP